MPNRHKSDNSERAKPYRQLTSAVPMSDLEHPRRWSEEEVKGGREREREEEREGKGQRWTDEASEAPDPLQDVRERDREIEEGKGEERAEGDRKATEWPLSLSDGPR